MNDGLKYMLMEMLSKGKILNEQNYAQIRAELDTQYSTNQVSRHRHFTDLLKELNGFPSFVGIKLKKTPDSSYVLVAEYEFRYTNSDNKDVQYLVTVQFKEFDQILEDLNETLKVKIKKLFDGELGLHCTCKSFRYRYNYVANKKSSGIESETRPAGVTNPNDIGIGCKHIALCMQPQVFKFIRNDVYSFINKMFTDAKKEAMAKDPTLKGVVDKKEKTNSTVPQGVDDDNGNSDTELQQPDKGSEQ